MSNILRPKIDELQLLPNCLRKLEMYQSDPDIAFDTKEHNRRHDQSVLLIPNRQRMLVNRPKSALFQPKSPTKTCCVSAEKHPKRPKYNLYQSKNPRTSQNVIYIGQNTPKLEKCYRNQVGLRRNGPNRVRQVKLG